MLATLPLPARAASAPDLRRLLRQDPDAPVALDASALDRVLRHDAPRGLLEVQAGGGWRTVAAALEQTRPRLGGLAATATLPATVGESVAANAPGPDGVPLVAHVEALTVATADGELRRASRFANAELFRLAVGGQGAIGIFYSVTLRLDSLEQSFARAEDAARQEPPRAARGDSACLLVPPGALQAFLADARAYLDQRRAALLGVAIRATRAEHESFLRWAVRDYARVSLAFDAGATLGHCVRATEIRRALMTLALERGGGFAPAHCVDATREQLAAAYPTLAEFLARARRFDPAGRLQNHWARHCRRLLQPEPFEVRWER